MVEGEIVIDETLSKENIRKLLQESISTPKQFLEELKHRFQKISYGIFSGKELVDQNFGLSYDEHLPLGNFLDEKIKPEEYKVREVSVKRTNFNPRQS